MSNFAKGLQVAGIGLVIVFSVLIILITVITLLTKVLHSFSDRKKPAKAAVPAPAAPAAPAAAPAPADEETVDDGELIAVIAAAVAACAQNGNLVVRRVRRVPAWRNAALNETVTRF